MKTCKLILLSIFSLAAFGCNDKNSDDAPILSPEFLQQTSWAATYVNNAYPEDITTFDIIFLNKETASLRYNKDTDYTTYTIENTRLFNISLGPAFLSGYWILDEIRNDYMRFLKNNYSNQDELITLEFRKVD